jgi:hypothetical protein
MNRNRSSISCARAALALASTGAFGIPIIDHAGGRDVNGGGLKDAVLLNPDGIVGRVVFGAAERTEPGIPVEVPCGRLQLARLGERLPDQRRRRGLIGLDSCWSHESGTASSVLLHPGHLALRDGGSYDMTEASWVCMNFSGGVQVEHNSRCS